MTGVCVCVCRSEDRNTEQERRLVDDITAPGGVKAAPPRDTLSTFISRLASLSPAPVPLFSAVCGVWLELQV